MKDTRVKRRIVEDIYGKYSVRPSYARNINNKNLPYCHTLGKDNNLIVCDESDCNHINCGFRRGVKIIG